MSYDLLSRTACLPVFVPESLLRLKIPEEMMLAAIHTFNEQIKVEPLIFKNGNRNKAKVKDLYKNGDDLFLRILCFDDDGYRLDELAANLMGYVMMNKDTGEIAELVIEGFKWMKKKSVDFWDKT